MRTIERRTFLSTLITPGVVSVAAAVAAKPAFAQLSPPKDVTAMIGGKEIAIAYYAPSMRGRKIMGALVPYGEVWCTGANWATTITSKDAGLEIGTIKLPKGAYAIWTLPNEKEWELIVNSNTRAFHLDYDGSKDIGRTKMSLKTLAEPVEQFRIEIRPNGGNKATLALMWEKTEASVPIVVAG